MVSSKYSNSQSRQNISAKGALRGALLLIFLLLVVDPCCAIHRDTLGVGGRNFFVQNLGQWDAPILFKSRMHGAVLYAESNRLTVTLSSPKADIDGLEHPHMPSRYHAYQVNFVGSNTYVQVEGRDIDTLDGYDNYYYGRSPSKWFTRLPHYRTLYYHNLYAGIDMDVLTAQHALKTNYYVSPGASPSDIVMRYDGVDKIYLSGYNLIIRTSVGEVVEISPYAYQESDTGRVDITARYQVSNNEVRFRIANYDTTRPLVIDPVLHFSTYTGSPADNWGTTATYDAYNNTYTAGLVFGQGQYPTSPGAFDTHHNGNADVGIFKFDSSGSRRYFATYLGGEFADMPHSMFVNAFNELVVFGTTGSSDFPVTSGAFDTTFNGGSRIHYDGSSDIYFPNGSDIFVCRFSADGTQLLASTYVGGTQNDGLNYRDNFSAQQIMCGNDSLYYNYGDGSRGELITDDANNIYVGSTTFSDDFPVTPGCIQQYAAAGQKGVIFKLDYHLQHLLWSTYIGGSNADAVYSIDVDTSYNVLVCGGTSSHNFPVTLGSYQTHYGGGSADGFIAKISYNGDSLLASTFFGSSEYDQAYFVRTAQNNHVYIYGQTKAPDSTMIFNAEYNVPGAGMLIAHFAPNLDQLVWSTVFGTPQGHPNLSPSAFATDVCNRIYAAGWGRDMVHSCVGDWNISGTTGMQVTADAIQSTTDGEDFYIISLNQDASAIEFATFFGELHDDDYGYYHGRDHVDGGTSRFDKFSTLYQSVCASCGGSDQFPTTAGVWSNTNPSTNCNNAVFRLNVHNDYALAQCLQPHVGCYPPYTVRFENTSRGTSYEWDFGDGTTSTEHSPEHTFTQSGTFRVRLVAHLENGCRSHDTAYLNVRILDPSGNRNHAQATCDLSPVNIGIQPLPGCTYHWLTPGVSDSTIANPYVTTSGTYILLITTADSCTELDTFNVEFIRILDNLEVHSPTCPDGTNGYALAQVRPDSEDDAIYIWDGDTNHTSFPNLLPNLLPGGRHTLRIISRGCVFDTTFVVPNAPRLEYEVEMNDVLCGDDCDGWIRLQYHYPNSNHVYDTILQNLCEGEYTIHFSDTLGCPYATSATIIRDTALRHLRIWADDSAFFLTQSVKLHVTDVPGARYRWNNTCDEELPSNSTVVVTPTDTISVYDCLVTDTLGCTWHGSIMLRCSEVVCDRPNIFIPNAFSPNGDGVNDKLCCRGRFIIDFNLAIYSRWGEKVFETNDINDCWDGRYNGQWCVPGVYTYYCRVKCEAGFQNTIKGDITLIR